MLKQVSYSEVLTRWRETIELKTFILSGILFIRLFINVSFDGILVNRELLMLIDFERYISEWPMIRTLAIYTLSTDQDYFIYHYTTTYLPCYSKSSLYGTLLSGKFTVTVFGNYYPWFYLR